MPPSMCAIINTLTHTQLLQRCSLSLHPIYGTVSTLYLLITYTSAIGGKYATCSDAFEDFISSRVNTSWWCCCCCVFFFYIFASSLIRSYQKLEPAHVYPLLDGFEARGFHANTTQCSSQVLCANPFHCCYSRGRQRDWKNPLVNALVLMLTKRS